MNKAVNKALEKNSKICSKQIKPCTNHVESKGRLSDLLKNYKFDSEDAIGEGGFGTVFKAYSTREPDLGYAIKKIKKPVKNAKELQSLYREINIL